MIFLQFIKRKNPLIQEAVEYLDQHFDVHFDANLKVHQCVRMAFASLGTAELEFIKKEIKKCREPITGARYYLENYHVIKDEKTGQLVTLNQIWDSQEIFFERVIEIQLAGRPVKILVLKARQLGLSTFSEALVFHKTIFTQGCNALIVAQDIYQSDYLFTMSRVAYDYLPWWMKPDKWYEAKGKYMEFDRQDPGERWKNPGLKSKIFVEAANKMLGVAVGKTMRAAHLSELSRWPNGEVLSEQILPSLNAPDSLVILESTALGKDNFFYKFWTQVWNGQIPTWTPVFIEFFRVRKYSIPIPKNEKFEPTKEEKALRSKILREKDIYVTDEQLYWRRTKIQETVAIKGSESSFYQEYPAASWIEAFQGSGLCAFNRKQLQIIMETTCKSPIWFGEVDMEVAKDGARTAKLTPHYYMTKAGIVANGGKVVVPPQVNYGARLRIWEEPTPDDAYYIGADCAKGIEGGDFSCAQVIKIGRGTNPDVQVAEWHGYIDATPYAKVLWCLAAMYNNAEIAVEVNEGYGLSTNNYLLHTLEHERVFIWKKYDKIKNTMTDYYGWLTTVKTRPMLINKMRESLNEDTLIIQSEEVVDQMSDFGQGEKTQKIEGQSGNDDRVLALMIAEWCAHDSEYGQKVAATPIDEEKKNKDFQNTAFSPIHDKDGLQRLVVEEMNVPPEFALEMALYQGSTAANIDEDEQWKTW